MRPAFTPGDLVKLKSGGSIMTVAGAQSYKMDTSQMQEGQWAFPVDSVIYTLVWLCDDGRMLQSTVLEPALSLIQ